MINRLFFLANTSTENLLFKSVAVDIIGAAFISLAIFLVKSLPQPICPERSEITNCPSSSITRTQGSVVLFFTNGAIERTAIPQALINISTFSDLKYC